jgi:hypothetical protein
MQDGDRRSGKSLTKKEFKIWFLEKSAGQMFTNLSIT